MPTAATASASRRLAGYAAVAVLAYAGFVCLLVGLGPETLDLVLWNTAPLAVPLIIVVFAQRDATRWAAAILLALMWMLNAAVLLWGLALDPGDYNHLVGFFLPLHELFWLAVGSPVLWLLSLLVQAVGKRSPGPNARQR